MYGSYMFGIYTAQETSILFERLMSYSPCTGEFADGLFMAQHVTPADLSVDVIVQTLRRAAVRRSVRPFADGRLLIRIGCRRIDRHARA